MARTPPTVVRRALKIKEPKIRINANDNDNDNTNNINVNVNNNNRALALFRNGTVTPRGDSRRQHDPAVFSTLLQSVMFTPAPSDEEDVLPQVLTLANVGTPSDGSVLTPETQSPPSEPATPCPKGSSAGRPTTHLAIRVPSASNKASSNFAIKRKREKKDKGEKGKKESPALRKKRCVASLEEDVVNAKDPERVGIFGPGRAAVPYGSSSSTARTLRRKTETDRVTSRICFETPRFGCWKGR